MGVTNTAEQSRPGVYNVLKDAYPAEVPVSEAYDAQLKSTLSRGIKILSMHGIHLNENATTADIVEKIGAIPSIAYMSDVTGLFKNITTEDVVSEWVIPIGNAINQGVVNLTNAFSELKGVKKITLNTLAKDTISGAVVHILANAFANSDVEVIDLSSHTNGFVLSTLSSGAWRNCTKLKAILGEIRPSDSATFQEGTLSNCISLEEIYFVAGSIKQNMGFPQSPNLIDESVQSVIDGLCDNSASETALYLQFNSVVSDKLTDEQILEIVNKGWVVM